jgi:hypothetical protein
MGRKNRNGKKIINNRSIGAKKVHSNLPGPFHHHITGKAFNVRLAHTPVSPSGDTVPDKEKKSDNRDKQSYDA